MTLRCRYCQETKPLEAFVRDKRLPSGRRLQCKRCRNLQTKEYNRLPEQVAHRRRKYEETAERRRAYSRDWYYKNGRAAKFGLTAEELRVLEEHQQGRCMICGAPVTGTLHADHDEESGRFRGLLCGSCNRGLGMFKHQIARLLAAAAYLHRFNES